MATRIKMGSSLFKKDFREKETENEIENENIRKWNLLREETYNYYFDNLSRLNIKSSHSGLIPVVHGTDYPRSKFICMTGFASLSLVDSGYYGKGIYFTTSSFYSIPYMVNSLKPSLIVSWIIPGNIYPVIESPGIGIDKTPSITGKSLLGFPLKSGFDCHYVKTSIDGYPSHMINKEGINYYDEFIFVQEHQILPVFILKLNDFQIRKLYSSYQEEVTSLNKGSNGVNIILDNKEIIFENNDKAIDINLKNNEKTSNENDNIDRNSFNVSRNRNDNYSAMTKHDLELINLQLKQEILSVNQKNLFLEKEIAKYQEDGKVIIDYRFQESHNRNWTNNEETISLINLASENETI